MNMYTCPIRVVYVHSGALSESTMSSSRLVPPSGDAGIEEDLSELGASSASVVTDPSRGTTSETNPVVYKSVWDFEKMERRGGP